MAINGLALGTNNISAQLATKLDVAGGKILQIVRATDATNRSTTSDTFVDASISVTITPQKSTSTILVLWAAACLKVAGAELVVLQITDSSNVALSGAEGGRVGDGNAASDRAFMTLIGYSTPATTSATTYKGRFASVSLTTVTIENSNNTGQLYAIEVSA